MQSLCKAADLSCRKVSGIWVVEKSTINPLVVAIGPKLQLSFKTVGVRDLISVVAENYNLKVTVSADIKARFDLICFSSVTPGQTLAQIALAADLNLVEKDGVWNFSPRKPIAP